MTANFTESEYEVDLAGVQGIAGYSAPIANNTVLANVSGSSAVPSATSASDMRTLMSAVSYASQSLSGGEQTQARENINAASETHAHGNVTNAGAIGSTANLPIITGASGVLSAGSFGTTANTFCQGNDSRLSDTRTPNYAGIVREGYTSGTSPREITAGSNTKLLQVDVPNFDDGQPDKTVIAALVTNGVTYLYVGGGISFGKECAQAFYIFLGADNTALGQLYASFETNGTFFRKNALAIGKDAPPSQGLDVQANTFRLGSDQVSNSTRSANADKIFNFDMPNYVNDGYLTVISARTLSTGSTIFLGGGGVVVGDAPDNVQIYTTPATSQGSLRMHVDSTGVMMHTSTSISLIANDSYCVEKVSNTRIRFKLRGSDGVTRSAELDLS